VTLLRIESHSDNRGSAEFNLELTAKRALSIARWLVHHGIECHRLHPVGFGDARPIVEDDHPSDSKSRRIELHNAAIHGRMILPLEPGGLVAGDPCQG